MSTKKSKTKTKTYEVEKIVKKRIVGDSKIQYFIKWVGFDASENTWEPEEHILDKNLIEEFESEQTEQTNGSRAAASQPQQTKQSPKTPVKHKSMTVKAMSSASKPSTPKASASKRIKTEEAPTPAAKDTPAEDEDDADEETEQLSVTQPSITTDSGDDEVRILGAKPDKGIIMFLIEFPESRKLQFIESTVANKKYPQQVIKFYEARLDWLAEDVGN